MTGRASRRKGIRFEQELAKIFRIAFDVDVSRGWQARVGSDAPDVIFPGLWIEAKHRNAINVYDFYQQAHDQEEEHRYKTGAEWRLPVTIFRKTGQRILCALDLADFLYLLRAAQWLDAHTDSNQRKESTQSEAEQSPCCDAQPCECCENCHDTEPESSVIDSGQPQSP